MKALESRIEFTFPDAYHVVKFDDTAFYRREFAAMPSGKGVDFLADSDTCLLFVEVKNCIGNEAKERWRTAVNGQKTDPDALDDESFGNDRTIRRELQHSLQKKLRWLNCTAVVTDLAGVPAEWLKGDRRV